jgi:hypothetical protein
VRGRLAVIAWGGREITEFTCYACNTLTPKKRTVLLVSHGWACVKCATRLQRDIHKTLAQIEGVRK